MAQGRLTLMDPQIESPLDKVDSKFTLVALGALRARQVNAYYNSLGEGMGRVVPPQVASVSGKPLSIAFEEIAASKATFIRVDPDELEAEAELESEVVLEVLEAVVEAEIGVLAAELGATETLLELVESELGGADPVLEAEIEVLEAVVEAELDVLEAVAETLAEIEADGLDESVASTQASDEPAEDEGPAAG
jgi:DNA-directed RNA polymerase subunit omega